MGKCIVKTLSLEVKSPRRKLLKTGIQATVELRSNSEWPLHVRVNRKESLE